MDYQYISIVIPVFNVEPEILKKSLESISNQTYEFFEVILVDDSTDIKCSNFCVDYCVIDQRFRYFKTEDRLGLPKSLNFGISIAKYDIIARFDSDDICFLNRFELQINYMKCNSNIDVLGGAIQIINNTEEVKAIRLYPVGTNKVRWKMQIDCPIAHPTVMFKKHLVSNYGGYDESFKYAEDIELWLRWLNNGVRFSNLAVPLIKYRQNDFIRNTKHYRYFLNARFRNFNFKFIPINFIGIFILLLTQILPDNVMALYYSYKYRN
ncbi:glycosyltransferase [Flavobacterium ajazii]|uniref:glycosyltransferase n=1 Tax=Flavobacterium ajazii TaxID=2692318 RepID=UPI0013D6BB56|nr:glycosyltransferase [Flavobacterium ajazii]